MRVGVLALQGAFAAHSRVLGSLGVTTVEVRTPADLVDLDGLVLPGGESTAVSMAAERAGLLEPLADLLDRDVPVLGTCAGAILLAQECRDGRSDQRQFGRVDVSVRRNAFGRQVDSFESDLEVPALAAAGLSDEPFHAVFIRAPAIERVGDGVEVLAEVDGRPCAVASGRTVLTTFHPELTDDDRIHRYLLAR